MSDAVLPDNRSPENRSPENRPSRTGLVRRGVHLLGGAALLAGVVGVLVHYLGPESNKLIILASFVPLLVLAAVAGTVLLAVIRAWRSAAAGLVIVLAGVWTQLPLFVPDHPTLLGETAGEPITVVQANIRLGEADADAFVDLLRTHDADVVAVEELTDDAVRRLRDAGIDELLPEQFLAPVRSGGGGTGIYSRFPLHAPERLDGFSMANLTAELRVGDDMSVLFAAVHPTPPYPMPAWRWATEMERLADVLDDRQTRGLPVIMAGDVNSTFSHTRYRALLGDGFTDAADQVGAGTMATYPADRRYPAVIGIDHIITHSVVVDSLARIRIPGSDHHGLVATVTPHFG